MTARPDTFISIVSSSDRRAMLAMAGAVFITSFALNLLVLASPIYMIQVYDRVLSSGSVETLIFLTLFALLAFGTYGVLGIARSWCLNRAAYWHEEAVARLYRQAAVDGEDVLQVQRVSIFLTKHAPVLLDFIFCPIFVAFAFLLDGLIGLLVGVSLLTMLLASWSFDSFTSVAGGNTKNIATAAHQLRRLWLANPSLRHRFDRSGAVADHHDLLVTQRRALSLGSNNASGIFMAFCRSFRLLSQALVLGLGAWLVLRNEMTAGSMIAGSILLGKALGPIEQLFPAWRGLKDARDASGQLVLGLQALMPGKSSPVLHRTRLLADADVPNGLARCISVEGVSLSAPGTGGRLVLKDINLLLEPGQLLAILGPAGSGKSALCRLLTRQERPSSGCLLFDGADYLEWQAQRFNEHLSWMSSDEVWPTERLIDLITGHAARPDLNSVREAVFACGLDDWTSTLPDGLQTRVGPEGWPLSTSYQRCVSVARVLYGRPAVMVFDDPFAGLDALWTERITRAVALGKLWDAVIVVATHSAAVIKIADQIARLSDGTLLEVGARERLAPKLLPNKGEGVAI